MHAPLNNRYRYLDGVPGRTLRGGRQPGHNRRPDPSMRSVDSESGRQALQSERGRQKGRIKGWRRRRQVRPKIRISFAKI